MNNKWGASVLGLENKTKIVKQLLEEGIGFVHYDVMDGIFVNNKSLPEEEIKFIFNNTPEHIKDIHLMVSDPLKYIKLYQDMSDYITFHYESESIDNIKKIYKNFSHKVNLGLAISPKTNVEQIFEFIPDASHILVMSVTPGKGGQTFMPETLEKIKKIRNYSKKINNDLLIRVDGGINDKTASLCFQAGADQVVSGSWLINELIYKKNKNKD